MTPLNLYTQHRFAEELMRELAGIARQLYSTGASPALKRTVQSIGEEAFNQYQEGEYNYYELTKKEE